MALSANYPQAFDENFHFGLIKIYAHYWLPFLTSQPPNAAAYGAVARDPSYLYHYLMSFPYRLISVFIHSQAGQVISLRLIDIALFGFGLILFRKVIKKTRTSDALTNISIFLFILIPIVPQLAAHINYDDLIFPMTAGMCLLTFRLYDEIKSHKVNAKTLLYFLSLGFIGTQTKYAFATIFAGAIVFILFSAYRAYHHKPWKSITKPLTSSWKKLSIIRRLLLATLLVISIGLFVQRDGLNLITYHTFTPNCSKVVSVSSCQQYGPWGANNRRHSRIINSPQPVKYENPLFYLGSWLYWMWYRSFFAINGPNAGYTNYPPLPLPAVAAIMIFLAGIITFAVQRKRIFKNNPYLIFFGLVVGFYVIALMVDGYAQYRYTDVLVAMNGRYLLPILLLVAAIAGRGFSIALRYRPVRKAMIASLAVILFLEGGGFLTFLTRSNASWDWPNKIVINVNDTARKIISPAILKGSKSVHSVIRMFD